MIYKTVHTGSYDFGIQPVSLVDIHSRGVDAAWMQKRASALGPELKKIKPELNKTALHIIAMGATEDYGPNRNADGFRRDPLRENHHTFVKNGHVYKNHVNKDPKKSSGTIKYSAFNEPMKRVDLVISVDNNKWSSELEKLANGEDLSFSMACVTDPSYPVRTKTGYTAISALAPGDFVLTHLGRWKRVKALNRRVYSGTLHKFYLNGLPFPLELTADHPMWAKVFEGSRKAEAMQDKARRYFQNTTAFDEAPAGWVHAEHLDEGDRFFYQPITAIPGFGAIENEKLATLMGFYLAEGSIACTRGVDGSQQPNTVQYACNMSDRLPRVVPAILEELYPSVTCRITPHALSAVGLNVSVFNAQFATFLQTYVGRRCENKFICPEIFNASPKVKAAYLGAWLDGDGFCDKKGAHISTASMKLALQGRDLLASMGIPSSIYHIDHKNCQASGYENSGDEYTINIAWFDAGKLAAASWKVGESKHLVEPHDRFKPSAMRACPDGRYAYRIKQVEIREVIDCQTWNIEVEDDESYTLAGLISHNCMVPFDVCSVCGQKAPTRAEYCGHMKKMAGQMLSDGRMVYVDNPTPNFFDISGVFRPADRIAYQLQKVASAAVLTGAELAELDGFLPTIPCPPTIKRSAMRWQKLTTLRKLAEIEKEIEATAPGDQGAITELRGAFAPELAGVAGSELDTLSSATKDRIDKLMGALGQVRVSLPLREFIRIVMGNETGGVSTSDVEQYLPGVFTRMLAEGGDDAANDGTYDPSGALSDLPTGVREIIGKMIPGMSLAEEPVQKRITMVVVRKIPKPALTSGSGIRTIKTALDNTGAEVLAREYAKYKLSFLASSMKKEGSELLARLGVLQNYVRS